VYALVARNTGSPQAVAQRLEQLRANLEAGTGVVRQPPSVG